jgi:hypothetical protein
LQSTNNNALFFPTLNQAEANSSYHGLQLTVTRRLSHGLQIQGAYTYSHAIDDASDPVVPGEPTNRIFPRNNFMLGNERGNSAFDMRHVLVANYVWELPMGRGRAYASSGFLGKILEGWQLSGITSLHTGHPIDLFGDVDAEHTGASSRLDLVGNPALPRGHPRTETGPPASAFAFADPALGLPGDVGKNHFTGPGYNNWDAVISKVTRLSDRLKLESRFECYNVFNRVQFDQPDNLLQDSSSFGMSAGTLERVDATTSARQIQFGMKVEF